MPGRRSLTHDTFWSLLANGARMAGSILIFYFVAEYLNTERFGLFSAALALFLIVSAFVTMGSSYILTQRISRDRSTAQSSWGAALLPSIALSFAVSALLAVAGDLAVPDLDASAIFVVGLGELLGASTSVLAASALNAVDRYRTASVMTVLWTVFRLLGVLYVVFVMDGPPSVLRVGMAFLVASVLAGITSSAALMRAVGPPKFSVAASREIFRDGSPFALTQASGVLLGDIDKQMIVRLDNTPAYSTGIYSAGNRILGLSAAPMYAVLAATYPRFFAKGGEEGLKGTWSYSLKLLPMVIAYAAAAGIGLFVLAPLTDNILGVDYADSIGVIRWMSVVPLIHMPGLIVAEAVTGAGYQGVRNRFIIGAGALNIVLNIALISTYGVTGAIVATYAAELFLLIGLFVWIKRKLATL